MVRTTSPSVLATAATCLCLLVGAPLAGAQDDMQSMMGGEEPGQGGGGPPRLPVAEWRGSLDLTSDQARALPAVDAWLAEEWQKIRSAREQGSSMGALMERRERLVDELRTRLGAIITPEQLVLVDVDGLVGGGRPPVRLVLGGATHGTLRAPFDDGPGDLSVVGYSTNVQLQLALARPLSLSLGLGAGQTHFDFSDAFELDPLEGDPFEVLQTVQLNVGLNARLGESWMAFASAQVSSTAEEGADLGDGVVFGGMGGVAYALSRNFMLGLGVSIRTQLEDSPIVLPLPIIRLRIDFSEQLWLTIGMPSGLRLTYAPIPELQLSLTGLFGDALGAQNARLDSSGFAPDGVFRQTVIPVGLVTDWRPLPNLRLSLAVGAVVYRRLEIDDEDGDRLTDVRTDPTGYLSLQVNFAF